MSTSPNRKMSGFTLVELLVVLAIASVLATLVRPMFAAALPGTQLKADTRILQAELRAQRSSSIGSGQAVTVIFCETSGRYLTNSTKVTQIAGGTEMLVTGAAESAPGENSPCESAVDDAEFRVSFYPDGSSNGARIVLRRPTVAYAIDIDWLTGRTAMSEVENDSL
jgi:general secretion pathway protein H